MATLEYEQGGRKIQLELKTDREYCIGRDSACPVCLENHSKISRRHCVIYFNTTLNSFALADLYSTNGTFLNGRKIGHLDVPLHDQDKIEVGPVDFLFHSEDFSTETRKIPAGTAKLSMISRKASVPGQPPKSGHFRFQTEECLFGNEKILEQLPSNNFAELYLTRSENGDLHLMKVLRDTPRDLTAGRKLQETAAGIPKLTGVLPIIRCGALEDGSCFWLTDYQEVPSYARMIFMLAPLAQAQALALIYSAAMILARGVQNGIFHGNLKPTKILYAPRQGSYIVGMGLSQWREDFFPDQTKRPGQWYAAPETSAGKSLWQSDQYALGIMLFQMLTGMLPFRADTPQELEEMHREKTMPLPQEANPQIQTDPLVNAVILRMTMKNPKERYESWEMLLSDMERANSIQKKREKETAVS